jgi:hypothetical protein
VTEAATAPSPDASAGAVGGAPEEQPLDLVPAWARRRWRHLRTAWRPVDSAALAVALLQALALAPVLLRGSFYIDDWRAQSYAADRPWWPFVIESNATHFAPGPRTLDWLQATFVPLDHPPAVVITLLVRVWLVLAVWWVLRRMVGPRWGALVPLVVVAATAGLLPATTWYRQSITLLPALIGVLMATAVLVGHVRRPTRGRAAAIVAWVGFGVLFLEKALVAVPWLAALTLLVLPPLLGLPTRTVVRRALVPVMALVALAAVFVALYLSSDEYYPDGFGASRQGLASGAAELVGVNLTQGLAPSLLGGPLMWAPVTDIYPRFDAPPWLVALSCAAVVLLGYVGVRRDPRLAVGAVAAFLALYLPGAAMIAVRYVPVSGAVAGEDMRLWADAVVALAITLALPLLATGPHRRPLPSPRPLVVAGLAGILVVAAVSTVRFAEQWWRNPAGDYVAALRASLPVGEVPQMAPVYVNPVVPALLNDYYDVTELLAPLTPTESLTVRDTMLRPDATGALVPVRWQRVVTAPDGPAPGCGYLLPVGGDSLRIPLRTDAPYFLDNQVRLDLFVGAPTRLRVAVIDREGVERELVTRVPSDIGSGIHALTWRIPAPVAVRAIVLRSENKAVGVCVTAASVSVPRTGAP